MRGHLLALVIMILVPVAGVSGGVIWIEAETPDETNFRNKNRKAAHNPAWFGGFRLSAPSSKQRPRLFAAYRFATPADASHHFWVRKFWYHGPFRWRFDDQPWQICDREVCLFDQVQTRPGIMCWIPLGRVALGPGPHVLRIETLEFTREGIATAGENVRARMSPVAIDCFVLSNEKFIPRGGLPPGGSYTRPDDGWFAFSPPPDHFGDAALDLRFLNDAHAGVKGNLTCRGSDFFFEKDQESTRFWGVVVGRNEIFMDHDTMDDFARRLAKRGVNLVRFHDRFHRLHEEDVAVITDRFVDHFNYFVAAMKREGIYLMINMYYDRYTQTKSSFRLPDHRDSRALPHFLFIHPAGEALWRTYARRILGAVNPHTGLKNAEDPALAIIQIVNEDNYFFHTFKPHRGIPAGIMRHLETRYGTWLINKYGSLEDTQRAWGRCRPVKGDAFKQGRVGLYEARLLAAGSARERRRYAASPRRFQDQAQFLTEDLRGWLDRQQVWLKAEMGFRGLVNGGNWLTADAGVLAPLDKYANSVCDVMDRHGVGFPSTTHQRNFYAIAKGDAYRNTASVLDPLKTPILEIQYGDRPHMNSEPKKTMPNALRADWIPMQAAYAALQGTDAVTNFLMSPNWLQMHRVWSMCTPVTFGQYPAAALMYRGRYIAEGPIVVEEHLALDDLYALQPSASLEAVGPSDWVSVADSGRRGPLTRIDPLSGCVGRVLRRVGSGTSPSMARNLSGFIDRDASRVLSATGQLVWDWAMGLVKINSPCAQGAVGYLERAGAVRTSNATIELRNTFASLLIVSMDGLPIGEAYRVLVQVVSEDRNDGWATRPTRRTLKRSGVEVDMEEIVDTGHPPIVVKNLEGSVSLHHLVSSPRDILVLDANGYVRRRLQTAVGDAFRIDLLPDCLYYVITREDRESEGTVAEPDPPPSPG